MDPQIEMGHRMLWQCTSATGQPLFPNDYRTNSACNAFSGQVLQTKLNLPVVPGPLLPYLRIFWVPVCPLLALCLPQRGAWDAKLLPFLHHPSQADPTGWRWEALALLGMLVGFRVLVRSTCQNSSSMPAPHHPSPLSVFRLCCPFLSYSTAIPPPSEATQNHLRICVTRPIHYSECTHAQVVGGLQRGFIGCALVKDRLRSSDWVLIWHGWLARGAGVRCTASEDQTCAVIGQG